MCRPPLSLGYTGSHDRRPRDRRACARLLTAVFGAAAFPAATHAADVTWFDQAALNDPTGAAGDRFGAAVDLDQGLAVVGAQFDSTLIPFAGSAHVFDVATGQRLHRLDPLDGDSFDWFGSTVAADAGRALVAATRDDDRGDQSGSAYLFDLGTGDQLAKLLPPPGSAHADFGRALGLHANTALVGAPRDDTAATDAGAAYLYDLAQPSTPITLTAPAAAGADAFGAAVALGANHALVGAPQADAPGPGGAIADAGAVDVFDPATGAHLGSLAPDDAQPGDAFGSALAITGDLALVAARGADLAGIGADAGAVYLFDLLTLQQVGKITAPDPRAGDQFGSSLDADGDRLVVSTLGNGGGPGAFGGASFLFDLVTADALAELRVPDPPAAGSLGGVVAIEGQTILLGLPEDNGAAPGAGQALVFEPALAGDANQDGVVNLIDFDALAQNFGEPGAWSDAEFSRNGVVDLLDFDALAQNFGATSAAIAVPTPAGLGLLAPGACLLARRRR
ncbi:MAG: hypothetical protein AAF612_06035 [Planctomycetota bacterium]